MISLSRQLSTSNLPAQSKDKKGVYLSCALQASAAVCRSLECRSMKKSKKSKSFVKALQKLKNLRPQLYSAADYYGKPYLHNEQKQMVLDDLKEMLFEP
ncbi:hypothetical protein IEQ34_015740 [Dendrobium chrysotoxum]|uniref:Uncharacterized protein n=1 Tax=Dendrobium chrysotoxum TaxID=161865 RepID=A0AAV7GJB2_DENCH|nr:hypothetical protein IEQ34_015740 [Dendrobium chrysotoxum]